MTQELRVLIAGESWETTSIHQKGFDIFTTTFYEEGVGPLQAALEAAYGSSAAIIAAALTREGGETGEG